MIETLKACLMFLGVMALILFIVVWAELAVLILLDSLNERRKRRQWWEE